MMVSLMKGVAALVNPASEVLRPAQRRLTLVGQREEPAPPAEPAASSPRETEDPSAI